MNEEVQLQKADLSNENSTVQQCHSIQSEPDIVFKKENISQLHSSDFLVMYLFLF